MNPALADAYSPVPNVYPPVADRKINLWGRIVIC